MACTTTDAAESAGNVRERRLSEIWAAGFGSFRSAGHAEKSDCDDCWLQTRHGHSSRSAFFLDLFDDSRPHTRLVPLMLAPVAGGGA
jgi:hypothetical protein